MPAYPSYSRRDNPQLFSSVAQRLTNMGLQLPQHVIDEGRNWYPAVHETVRRQAAQGGLTLEQGAGIVSAVSPNMDFENRNIKALEEIHNLDASDWDMINRQNPTAAKTPEVTALLKEKAPSMSAGYILGLQKAHRLLSGEQWQSVLPRRSAPKTHSFATNIINPHEAGPVTVDFRHADIIANMMNSAKYGRGISSAGLTRGQSRYENYEDLTRLAHSRLTSGKYADPRFSGIHPHDLQAILWIAGRHIERNLDPVRIANPRSSGVPRRGQPYITHGGRPLVGDWHHR